MKTAQQIEEAKEQRAADKPQNTKKARRDNRGAHLPVVGAPYHWKPGQSGNPGGRPKNDLAREIAQGVFEEEPELIRQAFRKALQKGNAYVFKELGDRAYGKVKETVEVVATVRMLSDEELAKKLAEIAAIETSAT